MKVSIDPDDIKKRKADNRGRVPVGTEHAGKTVEVVVLDTLEDDEGDGQR